ncbi:MAG TPA: primosomal protein N', partial [Sedimentisphaerales bacterium]|nr:primosomal protein N' [Sedimentisphaerales bacterium]
MKRDRTQELFDMSPEDDITQHGCCGHIIRVAFDSAVDNEFDYAVSDELWPILPGQRVQVPFGRGNKAQNAFCIINDVKKDESAADGKKYRLKKVTAVIDPTPLIDENLLTLAKWISSYYVCPLGQVLSAIVPAAVKKGAGIKKQKFIYIDAEDQTLIEGIKGQKQKQIIEFLKEHNAFSPDSAIELSSVAENANCTAISIKSLVMKRILKVEKKTVLKSLPAIPPALTLKSKEIVLNQDQQNALDHINSQIESANFGVTLLHGVTDSGKTEVYIRAIQKTIELGKSAIVLLPEIALTAQTVQRFKDRFERLAVMHSGLNGPQRNDQWQKIKAGLADVVIGARSAVFAPLSNLGLIVVDEEHETSYKQDTTPRYNGKDVAIKRAHLAKAHCILGSATPSLESLINCMNREQFTRMSLPKRVMDLPMPEMKLVDMKDSFFTKNGASLISEQLAAKLTEALQKKEQAILLLNRRGYSNFIFCPSCKDTVKCHNCDVTLTFHKTHSAGKMQTVVGKHMHSGYAICHYCGSKTLVPKVCPLCGKNMTMIGLGSQRLEEELKTKFPDAKIARIDSDSMANGNYYQLLKDFSEHKIDILAGTQILAKGLHFPDVTVVGIISADTSLYIPDFRVNERTFQLISQVAGRTGRSEKKGTVYTQTFLPDQPVIGFAMKNDFEGFVKEELKHRKACNLPPYWRLAVIGMSDSNFERLQRACGNMRQNIDYLVAKDGLNITIRGPLPAPISRVQRS